MARVYFDKAFDFTANKRGDTLSFKAGKTYTVTTPCAEAAENAGAGRRVDQGDVDQSTNFGPKISSDDQSHEEKTDKAPQRKQGISAFNRRVKM